MTKRGGIQFFPFPPKDGAGGSIEKGKMWGNPTVSSPGQNANNANIYRRKRPFELFYQVSQKFPFPLSSISSCSSSTSPLHPRPPLSSPWTMPRPTIIRKPKLTWPSENPNLRDKKKAEETAKQRYIEERREDGALEPLCNVAVVCPKLFENNQKPMGWPLLQPPFHRKPSITCSVMLLQNLSLISKFLVSARRKHRR